ncbi:hypothetical protein Q7P37_007838 [Cladosporium fusiforme]
MADTGIHRRSSGPYAPHTAGVGGVPTIGVDVPITTIFMALYLCSAATNMTIFQLNRRKGHKFLISLILFIFSMARVLTCIMRIVWSVYQRVVQIAIAAQIFNNAGVLILYLVNLIFAQRILRAIHPKFGWNAALAHVFHALYVLLAGTLIMVITATVVMFYTLNQSTRQACLDCQRAAVIFLFFITTIPLLLVAASFLLPRSGTTPQPFGVGSTTFKAALLLVAACLATTISGFKLGTTWQAPRKQIDPAWYHSRAAYYCFGFMLEILIICIYLFGRVDKRFHVPDGSSKRKSYIMNTPKEGLNMSEQA